MNERDPFRLPSSGFVPLDQRLQIPRYEGPTGIHPRNPYTLVPADKHTAAEPFVATPPEWTKQADCLDKWELFDEPNAETFRKVVKPICDSCPVSDLCLSSALEEEVTPDGRPLPASMRAGVRGGALPRERALMAHPLTDDMTCSRGHRLVEVGATFDVAYSSWRCKACLRSRDAERAECALCGKQVVRKGMARHMRGVGCKPAEVAA